MRALCSHERSRRCRPAGSGGAWAQARWLLMAAVTAPMIWLAGAGCNAPMNFPAHRDGGDITGPPDGEAGPDAATPPDGEASDRTVIPDGAPEPDVRADVPIAPPDVAPDVPRDLAVDPPPPDLPVDPPNDGPRDLRVDPPAEVRPDTGGPDVNGPVVCAVDTDCRFPTLALHCLVAGGTGSCVECTGDAQCTNPAMPRCDTSNGVHRCVECTVGADCPTVGTTEADHPSTCTPLRHCLNGCDDSSGVACPNPTRSMCGGGGGGPTDHVCFACTAQSQCARFCNSDLICVQCLVATDCASGQQCDGVSGTCVQCRDSTDCKINGSRLCNPMSHLCTSST